MKKREKRVSKKILAFAGSARKDSVNKKMVAAVTRLAEAEGAEVTLIDLADYELPLYNGDVEAASFPQNAVKLKALFREHDALLVASPEYNSSITPLLKNTIDWVSRPVPGDEVPSPYVGKTVALMGASPGELGGMRALNHVRDIFYNLGCVVLPGAVAMGGAFKAFDEAGNIADESTVSRLNGLVAKLLA